MSNETCVVSIADIYGVEWWERNKAELDREWEWSFGVASADLTHASNCFSNITTCSGGPRTGPRIILHRRKPNPPTLRDVYGVDEVTIPAGWEWTGEWRVPTDQEILGNKYVKQEPLRSPPIYHRLILRERPKKVWFKCEESPRVPCIGDWYYSYGSWVESKNGGDGIYLCATRHEEIDQTVQVVTQADVDGVVNHA